APEWSTQLDAWELTEAWQMNEAHPEKLGARVANLLGFRHPSGEEHCMFFTCDPRNFNDLVMIDVGDSTRDAVAGLRDNLAILGDASPLVLEPASGDSLRWAVDRSIRKTYQHDLGPLRHDFASLSLFTLLEARLACL
ncbi:MAG: hypothetical protein JWO69_12, partial [Thermoleophilia bacterium]|nr:hypothetical protein [Thermoleophilia bacterium]